MKLVRQVVLHYQEGRSDKVYEVDLCDVGDGKFVVNFRYGRRGSNLRDGSKTVLPVNRDEAERVFDQLVQSKVRKGYRESTASAVAASPPPETPKPARVSRGRVNAILSRLREGTSSDSEWPLYRAIWRAGELRLKEAAPLLIELVDEVEDDLGVYCVAWSLARIGDEAAVPLLARLHTSTQHSDAVCRIAAEGLLALGSSEAVSRFLDQVREALPQELRDASESAEALFDALTSYLKDAPPERFVVLDQMYLLGREEGPFRSALKKTLREAPLRPNTFKRLRHIFKAAELRDDAEVFGILAYRFEVTPASYLSSWGVYQGGKWITDTKAESKKNDSSLAFSEMTRLYLRRRVWRRLARAGSIGDEAYARLAVGVLLPFTDADAQPARQAYVGWGPNEGVQHYDRFARFLAFNQILYGNSPRYELNASGKAFRCRPPYEPGQAAPQQREEAYPELWDREPRALLHLLSDSRALPVHEFATRALEANSKFADELDVEALMMLLASTYEVTARLGVRLVSKRQSELSRDKELVTVLLESRLDEARELGRKWVEGDTRHFLHDLDFAVAIVTASHADVRRWAGPLLRSAVLPADTNRALVGRLMAHLLALDASDESAALAADVGESLQKACAAELREIGFDVVLDLLKHPLPALDTLAAQILLNHRVRAPELPEELIIALINAREAEARRIGIRLFGQLSDHQLLERREMLAVLNVSPLEDVRDAVRPVVQRLSRSSPEFGRALVTELIPYLLRKEKYEGLHATLLPLLRDDLASCHDGIDKEIIWWLLHASPAAANDLGAQLLRTNVQGNDLSMRQIVRLANNEVRAVREWAWERYREDPARIKSELDQAVRILDAAWEDSREFAFDFFREELSQQDWTPAALVGICDSVRPEVQRFGRELITRFFQEEVGGEYLEKLSQHPSTDVQLFATNYLERFAADQPDRLAALRHYFNVVLSQIYRGRVAKDRVFHFLAREAEKSEEAASVVAPLLARISATVALGDKASCLEAMRDIKRRYPAIELPIQVKEVPTRPSKLTPSGSERRGDAL